MGKQADRRTGAVGRLDRVPAMQVLAAVAALPAGRDCTDALARGLDSMAPGQVDRIGRSSLRIRARGAAPAVRLVVVGSHDRSRLTAALSPGSVTPVGALRGAGVASQTGPLLAVIAAALGSSRVDPDLVDLVGVSIGPGDDLSVVSDAVELQPDVIVCTEAIAWDPIRPTMTTGTRGRVEAELSVRAPASVNDRAFAGATLNPLNRLVELLGSLRGERGRIALPGFYDRAQAPRRDTPNDFDSDFADEIGIAHPGGRLRLVERLSDWPSFSVLEITTPSGGSASPSAATARVAFGLVPDQRPVDVERSLRRWLESGLPPTLTGSVRIVESARPHQSDTTDPWQLGLAAALTAVHGRAPIEVRAGGMIGAGELHYRHNAPVLHLGIAGPHQRWGTADEVLPQELFEAGCRVAEQLLSAPARRRSG